jgi:iron complex transport system ATP-binding protein
VISVGSLRVERGGERVLDGVSFSADRGELLGVVGPNGAGKTSLLRAVNGTLDYGGSVEVGGDDLADLSARETGRRVATVPQETALSFDFTVREVVEMGRHPHTGRFGTHDPEPVERALERTDTARFADRPAAAVSGGERKRVLIARALAQDAPLTLLDEPTGGLDVNHAIRALELAASLAAEGRCAIAAIHDLPLAARYCDRLLLLAEGGVLAEGTPEKVLAPETVSRAFDANAVVASDPVTGTPLVRALPESEGGAAGRVHVLGGGGAALPYLHPLAAAGFEVSLGPVPAGDRDAEAARALGLDALTDPPYAGPDLRAGRRAVGEADATLLAPVPAETAATLAPAVSGRAVALGDAWPDRPDLPADADPDVVVAAVAEAVAAGPAIAPRAED